MTAKIRCAVIGLGRLGYWHALNASRIQHVEVSTVCDVDLERAEKVASKLGITRFTTNPEDVFQDELIQAVIITTPTSTHFDLLKKASDTKKAIFIEKPLTLTVEEAKEITKKIELSQTFCQVGFMRRFDPAYAEAKRRIAAGDIGKPIYFRGVSRDPQAPPPDYIQNSGGIITDVSIHDFDIARFLISSEIKSIDTKGSILKYPFMSEYNDVDHALSFIRFESGAAGDIEASRNAHYGYDIRAEVVGTEGTIQIGHDLRYHNVNVLTKSGKSHDILPGFSERFYDAYSLELIAFFTDILEGNNSAVTARDGLKALEVSEAANISLKENREVSI
ncbi:Gfo/Idh/MocA family oxidoreductase [Domibacillus enclensis]|uniref:Oxidoreductase n=1 Tax=Domibacillus enclensis TaxID=1017273 RepID=A0A1N6VBM8_9BACI|nr:Gfo/Idh/MocA family oxidoreductase [Domibacillus enclensis]OXS78744.1 oxidoreductase [Domibacillus enclensis]SIQ75303.1 scyllo-inositol 2-dehydrogenase (NAD+) [Domibacillus enclensis]